MGIDRHGLIAGARLGGAGDSVAEAGLSVAGGQVARQGPSAEAGMLPKFNPPGKIRRLAAADLVAISLAAVLLLWPAAWNGYPIVFADTGTYLSQAIQHYAGWDRPVFYSLFMLPLHATVTVWPVVVMQALIATYVLHLVCRTLLPTLPAGGFIAAVAVLSLATWLPWLVSELMPDLFTPLLVLLLTILVWTPESVARREQLWLAALAAFMIASQQSSLPLSCALLTGLVFLKWWRGTPLRTGRALALPRRMMLIVLPPALAVIGLCSVNLVAHGRFAVSPFGNVFLLARVIYDGPGMTTLRRDCPTQGWRLCPFLDRFPADSDGFLWDKDSPLYLAGGPKAVSRDAGAIIRAAWQSDPAGASRAAIRNILEQLHRFESGDGLEPWPLQVTPWIERDFPPRERAGYDAARQQQGRLAMPAILAMTQKVVALLGVVVCVVLLPVAGRRRARCLGFLVVVLMALPLGAAITGGLSAPHDRYQSRLMWLPPFVAILSFMSLRPSFGLPRAGFAVLRQSRNSSRVGITPLREACGGEPSALALPTFPDAAPPASSGPQSASLRPPASFSAAHHRPA